MKSKDVAMLALFAVIAAVLAYTVSGKLFKSSARNYKVPAVGQVNGTLPDVRNESDYNVIFYDGALDPTQPVQIQGNNSTPFTGN